MDRRRIPALYSRSKSRTNKVLSHEGRGGWGSACRVAGHDDETATGSSCYQTRCYLQRFSYLWDSLENGDRSVEALNGRSLGDTAVVA